MIEAPSNVVRLRWNHNVEQWEFIPPTTEQVEWVPLPTACDGDLVEAVEVFIEVQEAFGLPAWLETYEEEEDDSEAARAARAARRHRS